MKALKILLTMMWMALLVGGTMTFTSGDEIAQPDLINYQGRLVEIDGTLVHGSRSMIFSIYAVDAGGSPLWSDTLSVLVWGGIYNVLLGPIPQAVFWDSLGTNPVVRRGSDRWLGITVVGNSEMLPRERIATVAYAIHADAVDGRDATEFVSSVHPDSAVGVDQAGAADRCKNTIPMLTVINACDGGAVEGRCLDGTGVQGVGMIGVYGVSSEPGGIGVHGEAQAPADTAVRFDGYVTVNGDMQLGLNETDYQYLRFPGAGAWGYLYNPLPGDTTSALDIAYNYRIDTAGNELYDDTDLNLARTRLRHGWIECATGTDSMRTWMTIDPTGRVKFTGPLEGPRLDADTLEVGDTCWVGGNFHVEGSMAMGSALDASPLGSLEPSKCRLHIKGNGSNHVALFENVNEDGDGIAIQVGAGTPSSTNRFVSFLDGNGKARGRIEGQTVLEIPKDPRWITDMMSFGYDVTDAAVALVVELTAFNICLTLEPMPAPPFIRPGACAQLPDPIKIGQAIALGVYVLAEKAGYEIARYASGEWGVSYQSGSGDYAEWLERMDPGQQMEPGDVVGVFGGKISHRTVDAHQIMVVSEAPIVLGNMPPEGEEYLYEKVAFLGQIRVKVVGPVLNGDYIIPSGFEDGTGVSVSPYLMTADEFTKVIGRAWSDADQPYLHFVTVAVGLGSTDMATLVESQEQDCAALEAEFQAVKSQAAGYDDLIDRVARLEASMEKIVDNSDRGKPAAETEAVQLTPGP